MSDPFLVKPTIDWEHASQVGRQNFSYFFDIDGNLVFWYPWGGKLIEYEIAENGFKVTTWYPNGQMNSMINSMDGATHFIKWDEEGNLIEEADYDTP